MSETIGRQSKSITGQATGSYKTTREEIPREKKINRGDHDLWTLAIRRSNLTSTTKDEIKHRKA